jgi:hypothetical protein
VAAGCGFGGIAARGLGSGAAGAERVARRCPGRASMKSVRH